MIEFKVNDEVSWIDSNCCYKGIVVEVTENKIYILWISSSLNNLYSFFSFLTPSKLAYYHNSFNLYAIPQQLVKSDVKEEYPDICEWE